MRLSKRNARGIFGDVPNLVAFFDGAVRDRENIDQFLPSFFIDRRCSSGGLIDIFDDQTNDYHEGHG